MEWSAATDVGRVRERNEDAYDVVPIPDPVGGHLFLVADGLGGHQAGDVASQLAIEHLRDTFLDWVRQSASPPVSGAAVVAALTALVQQTNDELVRRAAGRPEWRGMGTTLTVVRVHHASYQFAHVGDSRLYYLHRDELRQISRDHALVTELMRSGEITERQARYHPSRHVLTQAVGMDRQLEIDAGEGTLRDGDALLLCTDGLTAVFDERDLLEALRGAWDRDIAQRLIDLANRRGAPDNVTVIVIRYTAAKSGSGGRRDSVE